MKKFYWLFVCIAFVQNAVAQSPGNDPGMPVYGSMPFFPFGVVARPAVLPQVKSAQAGVQAFQRFMLKELSTYAMSAVVPVPSGAFGCTFTGSGGAVYNEQRLGIAYGRTLGEKVNIGLGFDYLGHRIPEYGRYNSVAANGGLLCHLTRQVHVGFHVFYPVNELVPLLYLAGLAYDVSAQCQLNLEWRKDGLSPAAAVCALEYRPIRQFSCMIGLATQPQLNYAGISCAKGNIRAGISGSYHPQLGITPNLMVVWQQKQR